MDAEKRAIMAISLTREVLTRALDSPFTMAVMTRDGVTPNDIEYHIEQILEYLEKTAPDKLGEAEG